MTTRAASVVLPLAVLVVLFVLAATAAPTVPTGRIDLSFPGRDPGLAWDGEGRLHGVWVEEAGGSNRVVYRRLDTPASRPVAVSPPGATVSAHGEVPPLVAALPDGALVVAYTVSLPGKWQNEIRLQRSTDGGATWSAPAPLRAGGDTGSHSELAGAVTSDGSLVLAWLDGREGSRGLRTARSRDGVRFETGRTLDGKTCECCGNAVLAGAGGDVWVVWRDASPQGDRDFAVARSRDKGVTFGAPRPLSADGWRIEACPHTGARLALGKDGSLWATWFTGADPGIYAARSTDGGATFGPRQRIAAPAAGIPSVAHPEIGVLPDGRIAVLYEALSANGDRNLKARLRAPNGAWGPPAVVATSAVYPRLAVRDGRSAVAFTRRKGNGTEVVVKHFPP